MIQDPKLTGREERPFDIYGWVMCILGLVIMYHQVECKNWWVLALVIFVGLEFIFRVAFGRVYKYVYFDSIIHNTYELLVNGETKRVSAENEKELELYMHLIYPDMKYRIVDEYKVESYIREDNYQ